MPTDKRMRQRTARQAKLAAQARAEKRRKLIRNTLIVVVLALVIGGTAYLITRPSSSKSATTTTTATKNRPAGAQAVADRTAVAAGCPASPSTRVNTLTWKAQPAQAIDPSKTYTATVRTTAGTFVATLDPKTAPQTVNNFVFLADKNFYRCVIFHRVLPGFVDQTGDPTGTGRGGPGYTIPDELPPKASNPGQQYPLGSLAMANTGVAHSGGSQWFIVAGAQGQQLPNKYALFGHVTSGLPVVASINADGSASGTPPRITQRILSITITET